MSPPPSAAATTTAAAWLGTWSRPPDRPAQLALALGGFLLVMALVPGGPRWLASALDFAGVADLTRRRRFLTITAFVAAFLSLGYVAYYLHGGPRSPLAATYWLQGRALSRGALSWSAPDPSANFRARDLLFTAPDRVSGIFPPGYAVLLAPAFLVGAPMLVGPLLAACLVVASWLLARELAYACDVTGSEAERIARVAAGLSLVSAALRYHTAEVLPQGATAVALTIAFASALVARRIRDPRLFGIAGLAVGFLVAAEPLIAVAVGAVVATMAWGCGERPRALSFTFAAALPGVLLLLAANRAAVGHAFASPAVAYSAWFEPREPRTAAKAVLTTLRGLRLHLLDFANFEPLALLALVPLVSGKRRAPALAALVVAGQILLALPFDASSVTPGAGAQRLASILPLEHALAAIGLARLFPGSARAAVLTLALALAGFAVHASNDHRQLAAEGTGHPHYEPDVPREANVTHGLLFFDDDQGFELAYDPGIPASHGVQAVRMRGDDHDRILYDSLGHPAIHRYISAASSSGAATVSLWTPPGAGSEVYRFEAESDWPPIAISGGHAAVVDVPSSCASEGHVLELTPARGATDATFTIALPVPRGPTPAEAKKWNVTPRILQRGGLGSATLTLVGQVGNLGRPALAEWTWQDAAAKSPTCVDLPSKAVELGGDVTRAWMVVRAQGGPVSLDKTTLRH